MRSMSRSECLAFLGEGTRAGKLATVRPDGRPHVAPIWFIVEGDALVFNTWHASVKARNLAADPRAALAVDDQEPPFGYVIVEGVVEVTDDPDEVRRVATAVGVLERKRHQWEGRALLHGQAGVEGDGDRSRELGAGRPQVVCPQHQVVPVDAGVAGRDGGGRHLRGAGRDFEREHPVVGGDGLRPGGGRRGGGGGRFDDRAGGRLRCPAATGGGEHGDSERDDRDSPHGR